MGTSPTTAIAEKVLARAGVHPVARIFEGAVMDFAFISPAKRSAVVRCVDQPTNADYRALEGMVDQGDFDRAVLIYCEGEHTSFSSKIESWPITRIDELAASLARESHA